MKVVVYCQRCNYSRKVNFKSAKHVPSVIRMCEHRDPEFNIYCIGSTESAMTQPRSPQTWSQAMREYEREMSRR